MKDSPTLDDLVGEGHSRRILVVEDESTVRRGLVTSLEARGHAVDAYEGVERSQLPLTGYDVAFLDHYFLSSSLTGVTLAPELRAACPSCRIVAMSSDAGKNADMLRMGADLALAKSALRRLLEFG